MSDWLPIESAPKDGSVIHLTVLEDGTPDEIWPMQWMAIQTNGFFPGKVGMWTHPSGGLTWNGAPSEGGPTHWRPIPAPKE